ncbi:MAG: phage major tail protein, TP901-1 family [Actinomycetia bacterium]|nr:phage major tail protein, TP901-1 family [Actinomycetes bacterium]
MSVSGCDIIIKVNTGDEGTPTWTEVAGQRGATLSRENEMIENTNKLSPGKKKQFKHGFGSWSVSADGVWVKDDAGLIALEAALDNQTEVELEIFVEGTGWKKGTALIKSGDIEGPYDDEATYKLEFQGSGVLASV